MAARLPAHPAPAINGLLLDAEIEKVVVLEFRLRLRRPSAGVLVPCQRLVTVRTLVRKALLSCVDCVGNHSRPGTNAHFIVVSHRIVQAAAGHSKDGGPPMEPEVDSDAPIGTRIRE